MSNFVGNYYTHYKIYKTMKKIILLIAGSVLSFGANAQTITTIAGTTVAGYSGDNGPATAAKLNSPAHVCLDFYGNLYFTDQSNNVVRKIDTNGIITTVAGTGAAGYSGDGYAATNATFNFPNMIVMDHLGNMFIADQQNSAIRKISTSGIVTTVAGTGAAGYNGDNIPAISAELNYPDGVGIDDSGNVIIADMHNSRVRKVNSAGIITTIGGTGVIGYSGDGGPATAAMLSAPANLTVYHGNIYIVDQQEQRIRMIDVSGKISTIAGNGTMGFSGDYGLATDAEFHYPSTVALNYSGQIFIDDAYNNRVRMVDTNGIITTVAGTGVPGYSGDGGPATAAEFNEPGGASFDVCGNVYVCDINNNNIRKISYFTTMPAITGPTSVIKDSSINLSIAIDGGVWTSSSTSVATVGSTTGVLTAVGYGIDTITYSNMCGTSTYVINVHAPAIVSNVNGNDFFTVMPNPSKGEFTINASLPDAIDGKDATLDILDMTGRKVFSDILHVNNGLINSPFVLNNNIANGLYIIKLHANNVNKTVQFSLDR